MTYRCPETDSNFVRCELPLDHDGPHSCPMALKEWLRTRGFRATEEAMAKKYEPDPDLDGDDFIDDDIPF